MVNARAEHMREHALANGTRKLDWDANFSAWLRQDAKNLKENETKPWGQSAW